MRKNTGRAKFYFSYNFIFLPANLSNEIQDMQKLIVEFLKLVCYECV